MRVPLSKVHRAFPELDPFSDAECYRFVRTARARHVGSEIAVAVGAVVLGLFSAVVLIRLLIPVARFVTRLFGRWLTVDDRDLVAMALGGGLGLLGAAIVAFLVRDLWLRWAIRSCLRVAKCPCGYSLLGLTVTNGAVRCPECGQSLALASAGLTEADLLARRDTTHPTSAIPSDSP